MRNRMLVAALLVCGACGSDTQTASASLTGTIAGEAMVGRDVISNVRTSSTGSSTGVVAIYDVPGACAKAAAGQGAKSAKGILLMLATVTNSHLAAPTATGVYTVYPGHAQNVSGNAVGVLYAESDVTCQTSMQMEGVSGTVTLTRIDSGAYSGTLDLWFEEGSHVTGSFASVRCSTMFEERDGGYTCT